MSDKTQRFVTLKLVLKTFISNTGRSPREKTSLARGLIPLGCDWH
jgi:hypothetical protein